MLLTLRGVPTIYSGDEQGFVGLGGDQASRQDMFASKVESYNEQPLLGTKSTTARANFDQTHPLYREIAKLARIRTSHAALTRGRQLIRFADDKPGLFALSRFDPTSGREMLLLYNTSNKRVRQNVRVETRSKRFDTLAGQCAAAASAPGTISVDLPAFGYAICNAR
jgi:glycosidase